MHALHGWIEFAQEVLASLRDASITADEPGASDRDAVAQDVDDRFQDLAMTRAAFLIGIPVEVLKANSPAGLLDDEVIVILEGYERLAELDPALPDVSDLLHARVLPSLVDIRSHLLFVVSQVKQLDPAGTFSAWLRCFQRGGTPTEILNSSQTILSEGALEVSARLTRIVSPIAHALGLWHERNLAEDMALRISHPGRFTNILQFVSSDGVQGAVLERTARVKEALRPNAEASVRWEWHHVERLNQRLPSGSLEGAPLSHLSDCGFVSVVCASPQVCYRVLGEMHQRFHYEDAGKLRDFLAAPTLSGYRSLHTEVHVGPEAGGRHDRTAIRIVPENVEEDRFHAAGVASLKQLRERSAAGQSDSGVLPLVVFTPEKRPIRLPAGATVLNFAAAIHTRFPVLARGARVNHERRGLLHPLSPGDVVWLDIGDIPRPLPREWEQHVPPETIPALRKIQRSKYNSALAARGRHWIRQQLQDRFHVGEQPDDARIERLVRDSISGLGPREIDLHLPPATWWLRELGRLDALEAGELGEGELHTRPHDWEDLIGRIGRRLEGEALLSQMRDVGVTSAVAEPCSSCEPDVDDTECAATLKGGVLVLHRLAAPCARDGQIVKRTAPTAGPQYLLVEGSDRRGLAAEVLRVCTEHVGIVEIVAVRAPDKRGLIRVRLDPAPAQRVQALRSALLGVHGVTVVHPPGAPPTQAEELLLPPRRGFEGLGSSFAMLPLVPIVPPYAVGLPVTDERHFYGMATERRWILERITRAGRFDAQGGQRVWIYGPLKVGKSSLAHAVLRDIREKGHPAAVGAYHVGGLTTWSELAPEMRDELLAASHLVAASRDHELPAGLETLSLPELVVAVRNALGRTVVLVIDEAIRVLSASHEAGEGHLVERFRDFVDATPGVVLIWVGPNAPFKRRLPAPLKRVLGASERIRPGYWAAKEIGAVLAASKSQTGVVVRHTRMEQRIATMTGGNPYWTVTLVNLMWMNSARRTGGTAIEYDRSIYLEALDEVILDGDYFSDRYDRVTGWFPEKNRMLRRVVGYMAALDGRRQPVARRLAEIEEGAGAAADPAILEEVLDELVRRGTLNRVHGNDNRERWRMAAPILVRHLAWVREKKGWSE